MKRLNLFLGTIIIAMLITAGGCRSERSSRKGDKETKEQANKDQYSGEEIIGLWQSVDNSRGYLEFMSNGEFIKYYVSSDELDKDFGVYKKAENRLYLNFKGGNEERVEYHIDKGENLILFADGHTMVLKRVDPREFERTIEGLPVNY